jgi:hypothetical protein
MCVLVQSGMLSCDSTVNTDWHCWGCWIFALCQLWSVHRSSLVWHLFCLYLRILYIAAFPRQCTYIVFILQCLIVKKKQLANCLKRAEADIVLSVLDVRAYSVSFSASLDMNQLPEKLYLGQNLKQYVSSGSSRSKDWKAK